MSKFFLFFSFWILFFKPVQADQLELATGLNIYHFDYRENLPYREEYQAQLKSTEAATVVAPFVQLKWLLPDSQTSYLLSEFSGAYAKSHFDGTTMQGAPVSDTNTQIFFRGEVLFYGGVKPPNLYLIAGLGYNYWNRFLSGGSGYREIYTWGYAPIGFRHELQLSKNLKWAVDFTYRVMFAGQIVIIFSETVIGGDDTVLTLGNKPGFKIQSPFYMTLSPKLGILFNPWYEYSEIGESDYKNNLTVGTPIQEPSSKTIQVGVMGGLTYQFE